MICPNCDKKTLISKLEGYQHPTWEEPPLFQCPFCHEWNPVYEWSEADDEESWDEGVWNDL